MWMVVKGDVARHYTSDTTFADVKERLLKAFDRVDQDPEGALGSLFRKNDDALTTLAEQIMEMEEREAVIGDVPDNAHLLRADVSDDDDGVEEDDSATSSESSATSDDDE